MCFGRTGFRVYHQLRKGISGRVRGSGRRDQGKSEMYHYLMAEGKTIFLNADDPVQREKLESYTNKVGFSTSEAGYFRIDNQGADPFVTLKAEDTVIETSLSGSYNFSNCAVAVLMGKYFNVPLKEIRTAIESYVPENNRSALAGRFPGRTPGRLQCQPE